MKDRITELHRIWNALADFSTLQGYDGWMIGSAVLHRTVREAGACDGVRSRIASGDVRRGNFAVMKHSVACGDLLYTLELHVVKPRLTDENPEAVRNMKLFEDHGKTGDMPTGKFPGSEKQPVGESEVITGELLDEYRFSISEILEFTEAVGDTNPIHRTANPVVPGLLIFRKFLECVQEEASGQELTVLKMQNLPEQDPAASKMQGVPECDLPEQEPVVPVTWRMRFLQPLFAEETVQVYRQNGKDGRVTYSGYETKRGVCIWNVHIS